MQFDLPSYFKRIGYEGQAAPTLKTLNQITEAHTTAIAFENLDVMLGRSIAIDDEAVFKKLVTKGRGGYCFEQNGLLLRALQHLQFNVKPLSARVRVRFTDRGPDAPRTHVFLRVEIDNESFMTDVGMGGASLTKALKLIPDVEQETPHDLRRLVKDRGRWYQQVLHGEVWQDANEFTLEEMPFIDREVANWYTSAHPQSHFRTQLLAARALDGGRRVALQGLELTRRERGGEARKIQLHSAQELIDVLVQDFGLTLSTTDVAGIMNLIGVMQG